jgi:hypothetical protein
VSVFSVSLACVGVAQTSNPGIVTLARENLTGKRHSAVVRRAIEVAVALHDLTFVSDLTRIAQAQSPDDAQLELVDEVTFESVRTRAKEALAKLR